jgi:hypothetical protein
MNEWRNIGKRLKESRDLVYFHGIDPDEYSKV